MGSRFFISDTHFGQASILTFLREDGKPVRSFPSVEEMDEYMVKHWNLVVGPQDTVYHLGDVVMQRRCLPILERLNGRKILIKGNHDIFPLKDYTKYFEDIRAYKVFPEHSLIASHMPVHPITFKRWNANVHGHLHEKALPDPKYINVSVEQIGYTPIPLDAVLALMPGA